MVAEDPFALEPLAVHFVDSGLVLHVAQRSNLFGVFCPLLCAIDGGCSSDTSLDTLCSLQNA